MYWQPEFICSVESNIIDLHSFKSNLFSSLLQKLLQIRLQMEAIKHSFYLLNNSKSDEAYPNPMFAMSFAEVKSKYRVDRDRLLGQGVYARVYEASTVEESNFEMSAYSFRQGAEGKVERKLAVKDFSNIASFAIRNAVQNECCLSLHLKNLDLSGIVQFHDIIFDSDKDESQIYMEKLSGGDLLDYIQKNQGNCCEREIAKIFKTIVNSVDTLHKLAHIIHCDIKPENLVFADINDHSSIKLVDFSSSIGTKSADECFDGVESGQVRGTLPYLAPELVNPLPRYSAKSDMWALGVLLCGLLTGTTPYPSKNYNIYVHKPTYMANMVARNPKYSCLSDDAKDLLVHIMDVNPTTRYTAREILDHNWCKSHPME